MERRADTPGSTSPVDVLIVGAGPVGLMAAIQLLVRGVRNIRIIDQGPAPDLAQIESTTRAIGIQSRSVEILEDLGIAEAMIARGVLAHRSSHFYHGRLAYRVSYGSGCDRAGARYPWHLCISQGNTCDVLLRHLRSLGCEVSWQTSLAGFTRGDREVHAVLRGASGEREETVRARWMIGCDGAHSVVRKTLGITFRGKVYPYRWVACDLDIDWDLPHDETVFLGSEALSAIALPMHSAEARRFRVTLIERADDEAPAVEHGASVRRAPLTREECEAMFRTIYPKAQIRCPAVAGSWFQIHCRIASRYRAGRVFLAGDSAHIHSPILGQGMNAGFQDATNLAWKLAHVLRGRADERLLDSYEAERYPVGQAILSLTDTTTKLVTLPVAPLQVLRGRMMRFLLDIGRTRRSIATRVMQLSISYRDLPGAVIEDDSRWGRSLLDGPTPRAGDRAPDPIYVTESGGSLRLFQTLRGGENNVLLFVGELGRDGPRARYERLAALGSELEQRYGDALTVYVVLPATLAGEVFPGAVNAARAGRRQGALAGAQTLVITDCDGAVHRAYGARDPCSFVLRADRHIGLRTRDLRRVPGFLERLLGAPPPPA